MSRSVYLAARFRRQAEMRDYAADLSRHGITVTSRWITGEHGEDADAAEDSMGHVGLMRCATEDLEDIEAADVVVVFSDAPSTRGGMWLEMGYALGRGIPVIVCGPPANIFCRLPAVVRVSNWRMVMSWLDETGGDWA